MKKGLMVLGVLILVGAAINLPCAVQFIKSRSSPRATLVVNLFDKEAAVLGWPASTPHDKAWPAPKQWSRFESFAYIHYRVYAQSQDVSSGPQMQLEHIGWPFPVFERLQMWWPWKDPNWQTNEESDPALRLHWKGVILNPIIFGIITWMVFYAPFAVWKAVRMHSRFKRQCCLHCGYPAGPSPRCSECGKFLPEFEEEAFADEGSKLNPKNVE